MANDPTGAVAKLDSAITLLESESQTGTDWLQVVTYVQEARDLVDEVPALVDFANAWLDEHEPDGWLGGSDYGTFQDGYTTIVGGSASGLPGKTTVVDIDYAHSLRVLRGRFALNTGGSPVFGTGGS